MFLCIDARSSGEEHLSEEEESTGVSWSQPSPLPMDIQQGPVEHDRLPGL